MSPRTGLSSVKRVSSSYVARVFDVGVAGGAPYVVREHIEGRSLAETVEATTRSSTSPTVCSPRSPPRIWRG